MLLNGRLCSPEGRHFVEEACKALVFVLTPKWQMLPCRLAGDISPSAMICCHEMQALFINTPLGNYRSLPPFHPPTISSVFAMK